MDSDGNAMQKPTSIIHYNHSIGNVELIYQDLEGLEALQKSYKWYKKLFLMLVIPCRLAAYKIM